MRIEDLFARFAADLRRAGGDTATPLVRPVWRAFLTAAATPLDGVEGVDEDLLMFAVILGEADFDDPPVVMELQRRVGLAEASGDYIGSYVLICSWSYRDASGIDEAQLTGTDVEAFAREVEATAAFRRLVEMCPYELNVNDTPG